MRLVVLLCVGALWGGALLVRSSTAWRAPGGQAPRSLVAASPAGEQGAGQVPLPRSSQRASLAAPPRREEAARCDAPPTVGGGVARPHCKLLEMVCLDQGVFVMHHPSYLPGAGAAARDLPRPSSGAAHFTHAWTGDRAADEALALAAGEGGGGGVDGDGEGGGPGGPAPRHVSRMPDPLFRARSAEEARPYLSQPSFSNCTVPLVLYPTWLSNYFHAFNGGAAQRAGVGARAWKRRISRVLCWPGMAGWLGALACPLQ